MATMKFKTNAKCGGCVAAIGAKLNKLVKEDEWSVDLKSPDKVLEVTADVPADKIIAAVTDAGFKAEQLYPAMVRTQQRQTYGEEVANVLTHGAGMIFGIVAIVLLLIASIRNGNPWAVGSSVVYALSMTLSYVTSTFYHASSHARQKRLLRRFDHSAIYLHIAGTYTPFTLVALRQEGYWGWLLFAIVWIAAVIGVFLSFRKMKKTDHLKTTCYLAMGWVVIIAFKPLVDVFQRTDSMDVLYWLIGGGLFYTVGCVFYFFDTYKYMHPMWHFFVLGGSVCHFISIYLLIR